MPQCVICGESLSEGTRTCTICGSSQPEEGSLLSAAVLSATPPTSQLAAPRLAVPAGGRLCPGCGHVYGPEFTDPFCTCGVELVEATPAAAIEVEAGAIPTSASRPAPGTTCVVLYGPDKQPAQYFALTKDAVLIGRLDAVAGVFPEIDVTQWLDPSLARKVSRQHALILRSRTGGAFSIRPLAGNTGTQLESEMVLPLQDYPLKSGIRLILGGAVRFKFEISP